MTQPYQTGRFREGNSIYPYEYFCGANTIVYINNRPALEIAGLSLSIREGKRPIYGYSSRHFDGVARGQVLVEGTMLVNMVQFNYLNKVLQGSPTVNAASAAEGLSSNGIQTNDDIYAIDNLESYMGLPLDRGVGFEIKALFGPQTNAKLIGDFGAGLNITGVTFNGEGVSIQVDSEVIVKAYNFFGRNIVPIR